MNNHEYTRMAELLPMDSWDSMSDDEKMQHLTAAFPSAVNSGELDVDVFESLRDGQEGRIADSGEYVPAHVEAERNKVFIGSLLQHFKEVPNHKAAIANGKRYIILQLSPMTVMVEVDARLLVKGIVFKPDVDGAVYASFPEGTQQPFEYNVLDLHLDDEFFIDEFDIDPDSE